MENIALWHERDISHSSVERVILADSAILTDYLLAKTQWLVDGMRVYPERMQHNLDSTKGLIFSGQLLLDLAAAGMLREEAYATVQRQAMEAWESGGDFRARIEEDEKILSYLSLAEIQTAFSMDRHLKNVDRIFARVFGSNGF
jgi:adenylosuccinate lyase